MEHLVFTLVTFVLFTALVGIISGKIVKNSDDQKTAKGYFLAGNGLGGFFIAGSMLLTNLSAENLVGLSGQSYAANMSGMAWEATAVIATIIYGFCVFCRCILEKDIQRCRSLWRRGMALAYAVWFLSYFLLDI